MNPYYEQQILSSDPIELVTLVYQRALASVREAREHLRQKRIRERSAAIMRAYAAIRELLTALRPEVAPDLCARLEGLYLYMQRRLLDANVRQADGPLAEVAGLLTTLSEAWSGVAAEMSAALRAETGSGDESADASSTEASSTAGTEKQTAPGYALSV